MAKQTIGKCVGCGLLVDAKHAFRRGRGDGVMHHECELNLRQHLLAMRCYPDCRCHAIKRQFDGSESGS